MPPLRYFMFPHGSRPACGRPHGAAPTVNLETVPLFRRGRTLAGPIKGFCHSEAHPHPPRIRSAPSPLQGEGLRATARVAPTAEIRLGALARQSQARKRNRTSRKFCRPRAQWPGGRGRAANSRPYGDTHPATLVRKPRRGSGIAPAAIFANPGPSGPEGIAESHSNFARRKVTAHPEG